MSLPVGCTDLHERREALVFLLAALDELQRRRLVAAEGSHGSRDLLLFLTSELENTVKHIWIRNTFFSVKIKGSKGPDPL